MATAYLLKQNFRVSRGLDRTYGREAYHVTGIMGWTAANTDNVVFTAIPAAIGAAHLDPGLSNAICTGIDLVDGPWVSLTGDGSMEAIVLVTYDSDRRWGAGGYFESGTTSEMRAIRVPCFSGVSSASSSSFVRNDFEYQRAVIRRVEWRDGTGITESEKSRAISYTGKQFQVYGDDYILASPSITRLPTNQVVIKYVFTASAEVKAFAVNGARIAKPIPALARNDEYLVDLDSVSVSKQTAVELYGPVLDPQPFLPYWTVRLY